MVQGRQSTVCKQSEKFFKNNYRKFEAEFNKTPNPRSSNVSRYSNDNKYAKEKSEDDKEKDEKKLVKDSGYNCHYCNGLNHFAQYCMLRKAVMRIEEETEEELEKKLSEIKKAKAKPETKALMVQHDEDA